MLKPLLTLSIAALPLCAMADFSAMRFTTAAGSEATFSLQGLTVSATPDGILVQNQTGQELFAPGQLASMEFTNTENQDPDIPDSPDEPEDPDNPQEPDQPTPPDLPDESSISSATIDGQVNVIDLCGVSRGVFPSLVDAVNSLPKGVYVGCGKNGLVVKFSITK